LKKLIIADLDGTLIEKGFISEKTLQTIQNLREAGHLFTVATGRHFTAALPVVRRLNVELPVICSNGAYVGLPLQNQVISETIIDQSLVQDALHHIERLNANCLLYTTKQIVGTEIAKQRLEDKIGPTNALAVSHNELSNYIEEGVIKILVIEPDENNYKKLNEHFSSQPELSVVSSNLGFLDLGNKHTSKGHALEVICDYLEEDISQVIAIGDQENDKTMLSVADIGIAMGNASQTLKENADYVTKPFSEDGFSYAIQRFVFDR